MAIRCIAIMMYRVGQCVTVCSRLDAFFGIQRI